VASFDQTLQERLNALREQHLQRELRQVDSAQGPHIRHQGQDYLNFSSNDYLGLANHPALQEAAVRAVREFGVGAGASRLICGSLAPFHELESTLAEFKHTEAALTFSTGYAAAVGTITALMGKDDIVILDKLVHASIVDATRLAGAKIRVYAHNDLNDLEDKLRWANETRHTTTSSKPSVLVVTESIFSMDGDQAPLREMVVLKEKYGAWLMVDEAHATGISGRDGRGLADALGVSGQIEIQLGTLGKALGASGGFIVGRRALTDLLINHARSLIFSTAPVPAAASAATAALRLLATAEGEQLRRQLQQRIADFKAALGQPEAPPASAIIPIILGEENRAVAASEELRRQNIFVPAIRYPTVARGAARLRVTLTATHSAADVATLVRALQPITAS
jgi:8-amino-7-oxononanoate synthase